MSVIGYLGMKCLSLGLKGYGKMIDVSMTFEEVLGNFSMACWLQSESENRELMEMYLNFYEKSIKAMSYYIMLPALFELADDEILDDNLLYSFFYSWDKYKDTADNLRSLSHTENWRDNFVEAGSYVGSMGVLNVSSEDLEKAEYSLTNLVLDTIVGLWDIKDRNAMNPVEFVDGVISSFSPNVEEMGALRLPETAWKVVRPTYPFDINLLFAHVRAYEFFRQHYEEKIAEQQQAVIGAGWKYEAYLNNEKIKTDKLDRDGSAEVSLTDQEISRGEPFSWKIDLKGLILTGFEGMDWFFENFYTHNDVEGWMALSEYPEENKGDSSILTEKIDLEFNVYPPVDELETDVGDILHYGLLPDGLFVYWERFDSPADRVSLKFRDDVLFDFVNDQEQHYPDIAWKVNEYGAKELENGLNSIEEIKES